MAGAARGSRGARGVLPWLLLISSVSGYVETDEFISDLDKPIPTAAVQGVVGKKASLPCDIQPLTTGDQVSMVLWFKESDGEPLYSYDVRGRLPSQPKLWSSAAGFAARAVFRAAAAPAALVVDPVARADAGLYRCRVDFRNSPTRNMRLNFTVITPPNRPNILDAKTRDPTRLLEPYNEGDTLELICEVTGGDPPPRVTWLLENTVIDDSSTTRADGAVVNALTFPRVGRQHLAARLVCQASNTNLAPPQNKVLILDLNLRPLTVEIIKPRGALSADRGATVECRSAGARPDAAVSWWRGAKQLRRGVKNFSSTNTTTSQLTFTPEADDHGRVLTCRAHNPRIPDSALEDKYKMNVHYTPLVTLKMGSSLQPALIKEGDDVYFECGVQANPRPHRLTWFKGDTEIVHNASAGVILSDQSLVLQSVTRAAAGDYSCLAANSEGAGASNPLSLQVRYAPVCATPAVEGGVYGALKHETVTLRCDVDSSPPPTSFVWTFNSSGEQNEVPSSSYTSNAFTSVLRYTPVRDVDFGTISCAAHNGVGGQDAPCLYRLIAASPPQSPQNCSVSRGGAARLRVACVAGVDGGLPQRFRLEVLELPYMLAAARLSPSPRCWCRCWRWRRCWRPPCAPSSPRCTAAPRAATPPASRHRPQTHYTLSTAWILSPRSRTLTVCPHCGSRAGVRGARGATTSPISYPGTMTSCPLRRSTCGCGPRPTRPQTCTVGHSSATTVCRRARSAAGCRRARRIWRRAPRSSPPPGRSRRAASEGQGHPEATVAELAFEYGGGKAWQSVAPADAIADIYIYKRGSSRIH